MATNTPATIPAPRQDPRQVENTLKLTINAADSVTGAGTRVAFDNSLPDDAFITGVWVEIVTAFNSGTTCALFVGTNTAVFNNIVSNEVALASTGVTQVNRGRGRSITSAGDTTPYAVFTQTGTSATTGQAIILLTYEGGYVS